MKVTNIERQIFSHDTIIYFGCEFPTECQHFYVLNRFSSVNLSMAARQLATKDILKAANVIRNAQAIIVTAGAGMGVDSGLPDFR